MSRGLFVVFSPVTWLKGSPGDEGWLAFVNTHCTHLERGSCWKLPAELRWPHQPQGVSPLHPGEASGSGRLPKLFPESQSLSLVGDAETNFKAGCQQFLGHARLSKSILFALSDATTNSRILPGGPIITWYIGSVPQHQSGICLGNPQNH